MAKVPYIPVQFGIEIPGNLALQNYSSLTALTFFLFYKKSRGADENYRPLESALNTNSDSVTIPLPSTASTWLW